MFKSNPVRAIATSRFQAPYSLSISALIPSTCQVWFTSLPVGRLVLLIFP